MSTQWCRSQLFSIYKPGRNITVWNWDIEYYILYYSKLRSYNFVLKIRSRGVVGCEMLLGVWGNIWYSVQNLKILIRVSSNLSLTSWWNFSTCDSFPWTISYEYGCKYFQLHLFACNMLLSFCYKTSTFYLIFRRRGGAVLSTSHKM